ncbi:hypothetical protein HispidOSU_010469, partial [Sigmodon hispidus]
MEEKLSTDLPCGLLSCEFRSLGSEMFDSDAVFPRDNHPEKLRSMIHENTWATSSQGLQDSPSSVIQ